MKASHQASAKAPVKVEKPPSLKKESESAFERAPSNSFLKFTPPAATPGGGGTGTPSQDGSSGPGKTETGSNQLALRALNNPPPSARLKINPSHDVLEQEADRIAEKVTGAPAHEMELVRNNRSSPPSAPPRIQRKASTDHGNAPVAPPQVHQVMASPGQPLPVEVRAYFEPRFGRDFSRVRVHTGQQAEKASDSIHAEAFTSGNNIAFGRGRYAPGTQSGRQLLAHELAHVTQQDASGIPSIQRKGKKGPPTPEEEAFNMLDTIGSSVLSLNLGDQSFWDPKTLISSAQRIFQDYEGTDPVTLPRTHGTQAMVLMNLFDNLQSKAEVADRGVNGELVMGDEANQFSVSGNKGDPWTSSKPHKVTDIKPFNNEVLLEELHQAASNEAFLRTIEKQQEESKQRKRSRRKKPSGPPPVLRPGAVTLPPLSVTGKAPPKSRPIAKGGSTTISKSLGLLKSKSLGDILEKSQTPVKPYDKGTLASHVDEVWYIAGRLYILDNTGKVKMSQKSAIRLDAIGLELGATYFMVPASTKSVAGHTILFDFYRVDSGTGRSFLGINPSSTFDLFDLMARARGVFKRKKAIAIVAAGKGQKTSGVTDGMEKFGAAMERVPGLMPWALKKEIKRRIDDPMSTISDIAFEVVVSQAAKYVPEVGLALAGIQLLELAAWFGDTANIAVYARTDDEISISAQIFALRIAEEAVSEVVSMGVGVVSKKLGKGHGEAPSKTHAPEPDAPDAPHKKVDEPTPEIKPHETEGPDVKSPPPEKAPVHADTPPPKTRPEAPTPSAKKTIPPVPLPDAPAPKPHPHAPHKAPDASTPKPHVGDADAQGPSGKQKAPEAPPSSQQATPAKPAEPVEMGDVLSKDGTGLRASDPELRGRLTPEQKASLDRLNTAYAEYKAREEANMAKGGRKIPVLSPEGWLKAQTSGKSRKDAVTLMGPDYAKAPKKKKTPRQDVDFKKINKPPKADDAKMTDNITRIEKESGRLWERLGALKAALAGMTKLDPALFNILKGNIGEILALPIVKKALADARTKNPDAQIYEGVRVAQIKPDGTYDAPKLFSDGLIGEVKNGVLHIFQVFETKSGSQGGAEARSQFFEWREGRFNDGDKIIVTDPGSGEKIEFTYNPSKSGKGHARGVQTSTPVVIATSDAVKKGAGTSQNVAKKFQVESLGVTAQELNYLARRILERESARQAKKASEAKQ